jgi:ABC-type dipeptide/oligopeptide/nickel transport system ATPase subunit
VTVQAQVDVLRTSRPTRARRSSSSRARVVNQLCDRIVVMYHGSIVEEGSRDSCAQAASSAHTQA